MGLYDLNGRVYDALVYALTFGAEEKLKARTIKHLGLEHGSVVMDWGCGTGLSTRQIEQQLPEGKIYAVERSSALLQRAVGRMRRRDRLELHFILANGLDVDLPEKLDAAVTSYSLSTLTPEELETALSTLWSNIRDGGRLAVIETRVTQPRGSLERVYRWLYELVVKNIFEDRSTEALLPTVERYFERLHVEEDLALNTIAFVGTRRSAVAARVAA